MTILGIDAGNFQVKVVGEGGTDRFSSMLGTPIELKLENEMTRDHMVVEFRGETHFAGELAFDARRPGSLKGITKANEEVLIRVLLALFRHDTEPAHEIVVGQPIKSHTNTEKEKIKDMLKGKHEITVNGITRIIDIRKVEVAAEGAAVGLLEPTRGRYHVLDVGSGTINWATLEYDGERVRFHNKDSDTETFGLSSHGNVEIPELVTYLNRTLPWEKTDMIRVIGAVADELIEPLQKKFPNASVFRPTVTLATTAKKLDPVYSNAAALYAIARSLYGKKR